MGNQPNKDAKSDLATALRTHYQNQFGQVEANAINRHPLPILEMQLSLLTVERETKKTNRMPDMSLFRNPIFFTYFANFKIFDGFRLRLGKSFYLRCCNQ